MAPPPSPRRALSVGYDTTRRVGTSIWPPVGTSTWPPVGTFSWPRTPQLGNPRTCVSEAPARNHSRASGHPIPSRPTRTQLSTLNWYRTVVHSQMPRSSSRRRWVTQRISRRSTADQSLAARRGGPWGRDAIVLAHAGHRLRSAGPLVQAHPTVPSLCVVKHRRQRPCPVATTPASAASCRRRVKTDP